jgi:hypothetical protein
MGDQAHVAMLQLLTRCAEALADCRDLIVEAWGEGHWLAVGHAAEINQLLHEIRQLRERQQP